VIRPLRLLALGAALPFAAVPTASSFAAPASAGQPRITCEHMVSNGNEFQGGELRGCSHRDTTGGSGTFVVSQEVGGIVITWASGKATDVIDLFITQPTQDERENTSCPPGAQEYLWHGTISSDTTGLATVGGPLSGEVCIDFAAVTSGNERRARIVLA
jgi:hypothetical protein